MKDIGSAANIASVMAKMLNKKSSLVLRLRLKLIVKFI